MKEFFGAVLTFIVVIAVVCGLGFAIQGADFAVYKFFAPKQEAVRREVFEQSKAYRQGMVQELQNMQFEYIHADKQHQAALASIILHRAADVDPDILPPDLRMFIHDLKNQ